MINEIGSEFCDNVLVEYKNDFFLKNENSLFLDSGRSAIKFIIRDIISESGFFKVYMPDFCCDTMIRPFLELGIQVEFYRVVFGNKSIDFDINFGNDCQVVFLMNYFGFKNEKLNQISKELKSRGKTIIYDATQALFVDFFEYDYAFVSLRKWFYSFDCLLTKKKPFSVTLPTETNKAYIELKTKAANIKKEYLNGTFGDKTTFLSLYSMSEDILDNQKEVYLGLEHDLDSIDLKFISKKRRENAKYLIEGIKEMNIKEITLLFDDIKNDVPLFVPISTDFRNDLRKYFIENAVYLPVHWPLTEVHKKDNVNSIYDTELSLVCDQRYDISDMQRILDVLKCFFGGKR